MSNQPSLGNVRLKPMQRDMFTGNLVKTKPKAGKGDHILLKTDAADLPVVPGMAHFAGTGPQGKRCYHCAHLRDIPVWGRNRTHPSLAGLQDNTEPKRTEKDACWKAAELFDGTCQKGGIQHEMACKYFEERK